MATERDPSIKDAGATAGPELRLLDRRAFVGFPPLAVAPGLTISDFALLIPDVSFPFNFSGGAARYQKKKLHFGYLELAIDTELVGRKVAELSGKLSDLDELRLHFRPGYIEGQARITTGERAPLTFKIAFDGDGERLALYVYDVRLYGFSTTPASTVGVFLANAAKDLELLPDVELRGATGFSTRVLPSLVQIAAVGRGYKMPALDQARLSAAEVTSAGVKLRFSAGGLPPPSMPDEELLLTMEGARAFADAENLLAQGKLAEARSAYLKLGDVTEAHPFAIERLLTLLAADPQAHELALDVAQTLGRRRDKSATALWAEAIVRERRGESARAAERYLALCSLARRAMEEASAFFAAESAARAARDQAPQMAVRALHEVLGLRPDHLPSLQALARAADQANDRAGAIRAWRRIAALARDPAEAAEAHVHMARLAAVTDDDIAGARLHCEAALRLTPNHPEALYLLGELCHRSGEHLRAIKALDRLREVALGRHEVDRIGRANVLAGRVWEEGLNQPENALLRYREAVSLLPGEPEPLYLSARVAEKLGKLQEAISGYQQTIELAGPAPRDEQTRKVAHASHHAMARLYRTRLAEPVRVRDHLEAALALDPRDLSAIDELLPYFRASGKTAELADALEKAAAVVDDPLRRSALWAEAGELYRGRLAKPDRAEQLLASALEADPRNRIALEGMLALAEAHRDGGQLCRCLKALSELEQDPQLRVRHLRRLAVAARDLAFDLDLAAQALKDVLRIEGDDLAALGELCALERRRADMNGLATALEQRARVAEAQGDKRLASAALRELSQVYEARLGRVAEALVALEKASRLSSDPTLLFDLADLSLRCERPQNARRALEDLLASLPASAAPERVAEVRARLGRACELLGDKDAAREHYAQAFPLRRLDDELALRLESLYEHNGELVPLAELWAARAQALLAADRAGEAAPLFLKSARTLLRVGERSTAILRLNAALDAVPEGAEAGEILETMAELELERGARREAAKLIARRAALLTDGRASARLYWRAAQLLSGQPREEELLASALGREPRFSPARIRRAELLLEADPRAALEDLEAVLALPAEEADAPGDDERLELTRKAATAAARAARTDTARRLLALYAARRPDDLGAQRELANLHRRAGAREALCDLLAEFWHRVSGAEQQQLVREYAELCLELGRSDAAQEALRALLGVDPKNLWAAGRLLPLLPVDGADAERLPLLSLLVEQAQGGERAELLERRASLHRRAGRLDEAREDLRAAMPDAAAPARLYRELAELCRQAKDARGELETWRAAVAHDADAEVAQLAAGRAVAIAHAALEDEDASLARDAFEAALALPLGADARSAAALGLADAATKLGDVSAAARALGEAAKQGSVPSRVDALMRRAALLEGSGDVAAAAESFGGVLQLAPDHKDALGGLKRALTALQRWDALAEVLAAETKHVGADVAAGLLVTLGELYEVKLGKADLAEASFRKAAQLDPQNAPVRRRLCALLAVRGEWAEAAAFVEELAALCAPGEAAALLREHGLRARGGGATEQALRLLRRAFELEPDAGGEALESLAELLYLKGAIREALPLVQRLADAVDFKELPERAETLHLRLAELAESVGDAALAESTLRRIVSARPLSGAAAERLAALVATRSPRESIDVLWAWAQTLEASDKARALLTDLARRAREELADVDLAAAILRRIAELTDAPLQAHTSLAALFRDAGRTQELMGELLVIADLQLEAGDVDAARAAFEEEAQLAEAAGHIDEALKTLQALRELCEDEGDLAAASRYELRRAELLRDAKLELDGAEAALQKAFELEKSLDVARAGEQLARRRDDAEAQADWIERALELYGDPRAKARAFLDLARLFDGPLAGPTQAEAAAREALALEPQLLEAEALLVRSLERDGRLAELAAHYEDRAAREQDPAKRSGLFWEAARIYHERAGRPDEAAAAVLAARAAQPDDLDLAGRCADFLHDAGRPSEAAEFDAILLEKDPLREAIFTRHRAHLEGTRQWADLAALMLRRAEALTAFEGREADVAQSFLEAAAAFKKAGARQQALLCEDQAFDAAPGNDAAWAAVRERTTDVRKLSALLRQRAGAVPDEARALLRERANLLLEAGEELLAAEAFDDLLQISGDDLDALSARAELAADAGGPQASQPWDRRLVAAAQDALPLPLRVKTHLRLGHAALASGALHDAADAFEAVIALEPDGERGQQALSLLSEVHARTQNADGLFRTSLLLAQRAKGEEAEALYRRASELFTEPARVIDALLPLSKLRPSDARVIERAAQGLQALGRHGEVVEIYERGAEAVGGSQAAQWLLNAAQVLEAELHDEGRADALRERAGHSDPENAAAVRALVSAARRKGDPAVLAEALQRLVAAVGDGDEAALALLELAKLARTAKDPAAARTHLEAVAARGASGAGYAQALEELSDLLKAAGDHLALADVLDKRAALQPGAVGAALRLGAARAWEKGGDIEKALRVCRDAVAAAPSFDGLRLVASLFEKQGDAERASRALLDAADHAPDEERNALLIRAIDLLEEQGLRDEAKELLERLSTEHLDLFTSDELSARFARLGAPLLALDHGYSPAIDEGRYEDALALADAAGDEDRAEEVLWKLCEERASEQHAWRLTSVLSARGDDEGRLRLAERVFEAGAPALAAGMYEQLLSCEDPQTAREAARRVMSLRGDAGPAWMVERLGADAALEVVDEVLDRAREQARAGSPAALELAAQRIPQRRQALLRELFEVHRDGGRDEAAAAALQDLLELEDDLPARSALHVELGELLLRNPDTKDAARDNFELALAEDLNALPAVRHLVDLYASTDDHARFVAMAERLERALGPSRDDGHNLRLADAYQALGRNPDAYRLLALVPPSPALIARRAALADELGLTGDALQLREKVAEDPRELETIALGYARAALIPFAVRVGQRLADEDQLSKAARRELAERLSPTRDGAELATKLWPALLRETPTDADGWTLFAEALTLVGRDEAAQFADGFGAALTGSLQASVVAPVAPLHRKPTSVPEMAPPPGTVEVTTESMPRLHASLNAMLEGFRIRGVRVYLHASGGTEAYLISDTELVIGAGALGAFGPIELGYLCALAFALGDEGRKLAQLGPGPDLSDAAVAAFEANPATLAASRVLALLDDAARGMDPAAVDTGRILKRSAAFRAVALRALDLV